MKYICINPEDLTDDIEKNGSIYGKNGIMTRIHFGKSEPEHGLAAKIINPCNDYKNGESIEADLTEAFEYSYSGWSFDTDVEDSWRILRKIFTIDKFTESEDGELVVRIKYEHKERMEQFNSTY